ncbi:hypothetical protein C8E03_10455 [Lachnotalea glycerini]|uniref:Uncharacterized protein n=1 Tax=Lachnotalea glycerini TaxID=1763509 RepID=A0A255JID7_9FIRM|nr:hypothetical protein [Lachnotalea glycerini]OYO51486.1 hypothetical protein CG709_19455 [Lachnotalea glycerini]PXV91048.1 hypothetical protein C8E03_10455 [Lachnotalea glycerini]RDY30077.1 hypothetical protein CG710_016690 [Lachnotalea glycerini]
MNKLKLTRKISRILYIGVLFIIAATALSGFPVPYYLMILVWAGIIVSFVTDLILNIQNKK